MKAAASGLSVRTPLMQWRSGVVGKRIGVAYRGYVGQIVNGRSLTVVGITRCIDKRRNESKRMGSRAENLSADLDDVLNEWIEEMSSRKKHFAMTRRRGNSRLSTRCRRRVSMGNDIQGAEEE